MTIENSCPNLISRGWTFSQQGHFSSHDNGMSNRWEWPFPKRKNWRNFKFLGHSQIGRVVDWAVENEDRSRNSIAAETVVRGTFDRSNCKIMFRALISRKWKQIPLTPSVGWMTDVTRFFACYILTSLKEGCKEHTYIGFTINPRRRIRCEKKDYSDRRSLMARTVADG